MLGQNQFRPLPSDTRKALTKESSRIIILVKMTNVMQLVKNSFCPEVFAGQKMTSK